MRKGLAGSRIAASAERIRRLPASFSAMSARVSLCLLLALSTLCAAQQQGQPIVASSVLFPQIVPAFDPITSATVSLVGNPGPARYCYWMVTNYLVGNTSPVKVRPCITNGPITLSGSNYDQVSFNLPPGAVSADVLRTSGIGMDQAPQGSCNCAVATGNTSGTVLDQSNSLNSYTVTSFDPSVLPISLTNEVVGAGQSHLKLRQNGLLIGDISSLANGLADPGSSGIVFRTTPNTTRIAVLGDVTALGSTGTGNFALQSSPNFLGTPTVPTQALSDSSTEAVNSGWVKAQGYASIGAYGSNTGNTVNAASAGVQQFPALGSVVAGTINALTHTLHLFATGSMSANTNTVTMTAGICVTDAHSAVGYAPIGVILAPIVTLSTWTEDISCTPNSTGSSAKLQCGGTVSSLPNTGGATGLIYTGSTQTFPTIDLTGALSVAPCVEFSTSSTNNSATENVAHAEQIN
jgi:hypothetical protein